MKSWVIRFEVFTAMTMKNAASRRRYVPPKRRLTQDLHLATSQKTAFSGVKLCVCLIKHYTITPRKRMREWSYRSVIYYLCTRFMSVVSFTPRPLYQVDRRWDGQSERWEEENNILPRPSNPRPIAIPGPDIEVKVKGIPVTGRGDR
jgi:hypothetical protein